MCYSALVQRDLKTLERSFGAFAVREQFEEYDYRSQRDPKKFPKISSRIYPGNYAPVVHVVDGKKLILPMRYSIDPPAFIPNPSKYTTYNARMDNLKSKFWSESYMMHHGVIIIRAFYEWVEVRDLLKAGVVKIQQVTEQFNHQAEVRRNNLELKGKKYAPTKTELTDPRFRKIVIEFKPQNGDLIVPVIFSQTAERYGFAIVTDDPAPEVAAAGHDRTPISLTAESAEIWLTPNGRSELEVMNSLKVRATNSFAHSLPEKEVA